MRRVWVGWVGCGGFEARGRRSFTIIKWKECTGVTSCPFPISTTNHIHTPTTHTAIAMPPLLVRRLLTLALVLGAAAASAGGQEGSCPTTQAGQEGEAAGVGSRVLHDDDTIRVWEMVRVRAGGWGWGGSGVGWGGLVTCSIHSPPILPPPPPPNKIDPSAGRAGAGAHARVPLHVHRRGNLLHVVVGFALCAHASPILRTHSLPSSPPPP